MADERTTTDPQQWRDLMSLPDDVLLIAWNEARAACDAARTEGEGYKEAESWQGLIEGAAASRFGVENCFDRYRARFPETGIGPEESKSGLCPKPAKGLRAP